MQRFRVFAAWPLLCLLVLAWAGPVMLIPWPAQGAAVLSPHRAVYDLRLAKARGKGPVTQAHGRLEFEWADACTGWTVRQRTRVQLFYAEGQVIDFGWILNSYETKDGERYRFFIRRFNADGPGEQLRGEARLSGRGGDGLATYSEPEGRQVVLPKGTLFPTTHSLLLLDAAEHGRLPMWRTVFDGSGDEGLFGVNAALSRALPDGAEVRTDSPLVRGQPSWRLRLAYFGTDETVAEPEHEQALRLFANGVVDELVLDYGDFALQGDPEVIEPLPLPEC